MRTSWKREITSGFVPLTRLRAPSAHASRSIWASQDGAEVVPAVHSGATCTESDSDAPIVREPRTSGSPVLQIKLSAARTLECADVACSRARFSSLNSDSSSLQPSSPREHLGSRKPAWAPWPPAIVAHYRAAARRGAANRPACGGLVGERNRRVCLHSETMQAQGRAEMRAKGLAAPAAMRSARTCDEE
eukprot:scaffold198749_cov33-Tisochrysis_lutea.AAC.2